jgi:hypothetical protein
MRGEEFPQLTPSTLPIGAKLKSPSRRRKRGSVLRRLK